MSLAKWRAAAAVVIVLWLRASVSAAENPDFEGAQFFETKIRPILAENCYACHGVEKKKGGLRLDLIQGIMAWESPFVLISV